MLPHALTCNDEELQSILDRKANISIILIPNITGSAWMEELTPLQILESYDETIQENVAFGDIRVVLLKAKLPKVLQDTVAQLKQATEETHLEKIISVLLTQNAVSQEVIEKLQLRNLETEVSDVANTLIDQIMKIQLMKFLMSIENEILMIARDEEKKASIFPKTPRKLLEKFRSPIKRFQEALLPKPKQKVEIQEDSLINYNLEPKPEAQNVALESTRLHFNQLSELSASTGEDDEYVTGIEETFNTMTTKLQPIRTPKFDPEDIEGSLTQLELLATQIPSKQHGQLIITFLAAANKLELLGNTSQKQKTSVKEFTSMVRDELGLSSKSQLSKVLNNMEQGVGESFRELKSRIINTYFKLHEKEVLSKSDQYICVEIFVRAIRNEKVKRQLLLEDNDLETVLKRANLINQVETQLESKNSENSHLIESIYNMMTEKCNNCGLNHGTSDCLASTKLQSKWKKATGTSRDMKYNDFSNKQKSFNANDSHKDVLPTQNYMHNTQANNWQNRSAQASNFTPNSGNFAFRPQRQYNDFNSNRDNYQGNFNRRNNNFNSNNFNNTYRSNNFRNNYQNNNGNNYNNNYRRPETYNTFRFNQSPFNQSSVFNRNQPQFRSSNPTEPYRNYNNNNSRFYNNHFQNQNNGPRVNRQSDNNNLQPTTNFQKWGDRPENQHRTYNIEAVSDDDSEETDKQVRELIKFEELSD